MPTRQLQSEYEISPDPHRLDVDVIYNFLAKESYWSPGIPRPIVERAIANSLCFGVYHSTGQVGFGRIVTDKSTFALLADVFILEPHRGKGLSKWLMRCIMDHEDLQGLRRWLLLLAWFAAATVASAAVRDCGCGAVESGTADSDARRPSVVADIFWILS